MISFRHVHKRFGTHKVLRDICLEIAESEVVVICGPSGAGKTTLLRTINALDPVDEGEITVDGMRLSDSNIELPALRAEVGMVFQHLNLYPHMSVLENIALAPRKVRKVSRADARRSAMRLLERVGLAHKADSHPCLLSGGEQQRVAIARSLAMYPKIMLLDEPTSALDPELTRGVLDVITKLAEDGMTMVIVTHEMAFALHVADRIVFMDAGEIVETGSADQVVLRPERTRTCKFMSRILHRTIPGAESPA
jgi:polar amino acid transport system ATP-binding protein